VNNVSESKEVGRVGIFLADVLVVFITMVVVIDQLSKFLASFFGLEIIFNSGVSLGWLGDFSAGGLTLLSVFFVLIIFILFKKEWLVSPVASSLFFGGAVSNILDRIIYGAVKDWLKIPFFDVYNNLADWFIFIGLVIFLVYNRL